MWGTSSEFSFSAMPIPVALIASRSLSSLSFTTITSKCLPCPRPSCPAWTNRLAPSPPQPIVSSLLHISASSRATLKIQRWEQILPTTSPIHCINHRHLIFVAPDQEGQSSAPSPKGRWRSMEPEISPRRTPSWWGHTCLLPLRQRPGLLTTLLLALGAPRGRAA